MDREDLDIILARPAMREVNPELVAGSFNERTLAEPAASPVPVSHAGSSPAPAFSEADLQQQVIDLLHEHGFKVCEFRKARIRVKGQDVYRTPFGGDGVGFPDLVAVKSPRVLFIELKSDKGGLSVEQAAWAVLLARCPGVEYHCWRPGDLVAISQALKSDS